MSRETLPPPTAEAPEITIPEQRSLLEVQTGAGVSPAQQPPDGGGEGAVGGSAAEILEGVESRRKAQAFEKALAKRLKGIGGTDEEIQDQYTKAVEAAHMDVEASSVWEKAYADEAVRLGAAGFIDPSSKDLFHEAAKTAADKAVQEYWNRRTWFGEPPKTGAASDESPSYRMALLDSFGRGARSARDEIKRLRAGSNNPAQPSDPTEQATDPDSLSTPSDPDETSNPGKSNEPSSGNSDTTTASSGEVVAGNDDSNDNSSRSQVAAQAPSSEAKNSGESRGSDEAPKGRLGKVFAAAKQALGRIRRTAYLAPQNTRYKVESFMTPDREKAELKRNVVAAVLGAVAAGFALKFGESAYDAIFGSAEAVVGGADPSLGGDGNYINEAESLAEAAQDNAKSNQASGQNSAPIEVQEVSIGDNKYVWGYFEQEVGAENATSEILRRVELLEQNGWDVEFWGDPTKDDTWGIERMTDPNGKTYDGTGRQVSALMHADYYDSAKEIANPIGSGGSTEKLPLNENTSSGNSEVDLSDGNGNSDLGAQEVASQSPQEVKESEHKSLVTDGADSTIIRPDDQLTVINSANSTESGGTAGEAHLAIRERFEQAANAEHEPGFFDGIKDGMTKAGMAAATLGGIALLAVGGLAYASRDKDGAAEGGHEPNLGGLFTPPEGEDPKTKKTGRKNRKKQAANSRN